MPLSPKATRRVAERDLDETEVTGADTDLGHSGRIGRVFPVQGSNDGGLTMIRSFFRPEAAFDFARFIWEVPIGEGWSLHRLEREYIRAVLAYTNGHRGRAAQILGIDRRTLYRKIREMERHASVC